MPGKSKANSGGGTVKGNKSSGSTMAGLLIQETLRKGRNVEIPSLGVTIVQKDGVTTVQKK